MENARINFDPVNQEKLLEAAASIFFPNADNLPRVPWFSATGQRQAFLDTEKLCTDRLKSLDADEAARLAILFWFLTLVVSNSASFKGAIASMRNPGAPMMSPVANSFVNWFGQETHPGIVINQNMPIWLARAAAK